jgi:hypothetical protein
MPLPISRPFILVLLSIFALLLIVAWTVLMPSWNWSFSRKDLEIYGDAGEVMTVDTKKIQTRYKRKDRNRESIAPALPADRDNSLDYFAAVLRGTHKDRASSVRPTPIFRRPNYGRSPRIRPHRKRRYAQAAALNELIALRQLPTYC